MGTAKQLPTLQQLLRQSDFVTLHVPELPETKNMISRAELDAMKMGSYLINASRGSVVDIPALIDARRSGKIAGFSLDVYPNEPAKNGPYFDNDLNDWAMALRSLTNIIITPHIGGSTEEAQSMIGVEVADALLKCTLLFLYLLIVKILTKEVRLELSISLKFLCAALPLTRRIMLVYALFIIIWLAPYVSSTIFSVRSTSTSTNNFPIQGSNLRFTMLIIQRRCRLHDCRHQ